MPCNLRATGSLHRPAGTSRNAALRIREHLTEAEAGKLMAAMKANRYATGTRPWFWLAIATGYLPRS
jgi:hypothetical protein